MTLIQTFGNYHTDFTDEEYSLIGSGRYVAQEFTPTSTWDLTFFTQAFRCYSFVGSVIFEVRKDSTNGELVGSYYFVPYERAYIEGTHDFVLPTPIRLNTGQKYYLVYKTSTGSTGQLSIGLDNSNPSSFNCYKDTGIVTKDITVSLNGNLIPNTQPYPPTYSNISNQGYTINKRPKLFFNVSDPDEGNTIVNIQIQISTNPSFTNNIIDVQKSNDSSYGTSQSSAFVGLPTATTTGNIIYTPQIDLTVTILYLRCRIKDNLGAWSTWSTTQSFTISNPLWSDIVNENGYGIKAEWMNQLSTTINNIRQFRGLSTFNFTDGTVQSQITDIKPIHSTERRSKLTDVLTLLSIAPTWTDITLNNTKDRKGQHIIELRNYCSQI